MALLRVAVAGGVEAHGFPADSAALVQRLALVEPVAEEGKIPGVNNIEDVARYFEELRRMQAALQTNLSEAWPTAVCKSKSSVVVKAARPNIDLYLNKSFELAEFVKVSANWGLKLVVDNCSVSVGLSPGLRLFMQVKGPVLSAQGFKIDYMPPIYFTGSHHDLRIDTVDDEIRVYGMCTVAPVLNFHVRICLEWVIKNDAGCSFDAWDVGVRAIFMGYENVPFPLQGLIPSLPTPLLHLGTITG